VPARIPSRGWRLAWVTRIGFILVAAFGAWFDFVLFGAPWASRIATIAYFSGAGVLLLFYLAGSSSQIRWIEIASAGIRFRYPFGTAEIPWERLRQSPRPPPFSVRAVGYEDTTPRKIVGSRLHWLTLDQARAVTDYQRSQSGSPTTSSN
jgi:hypothetical protein